MRASRATARPAATAMALLALAACADPASPPVREHVNRLLVPGTEDAAGVLVDVDAMSVVSHIGRAFATPGPSAVAGGSLFLSLGMLTGGDWMLVAFDVPTGHKLWDIPLVAEGAPVAHDGVRLGTASMALDAAAHTLYFWPSERDGVPGVGALDYQRRQVSDFVPLPGLQGGGVTFIPPYADLPRGGVAAWGATGSGSQRHAVVYFLTGQPLAISDSITVPTPASGDRFVPLASRRVEALAPNLGGREILVDTPFDVIRYDVTTLQRGTSITSGNGAPLVLSPADGRLFLADPGSAAQATSGLVVVYDRFLELAGIIDLHLLPPSDRPLGILGGAVSADGRWLYLLTGVPRNGPLYGPEFTRLYVVNATTGDISIIPLATLGGSSPILVP